MWLQGSLRGIQRDWNRNIPLITLEVSEGNLEELNKYQNKDLSIEIKQYKERRSLDSNAYAWVLMGKLSKALHSTKEDVYLEMLKRYSTSYTHVIVKENAIDKVKELYRTCIDLGTINVNGMEGHQLQVYFGSSTFNTSEMSAFIEGIVSECKEMGIETLPPREIERMNSLWAK